MNHISQHQTCEQCAEMCRGETKCCSFEWSPTQRPVMLIIMVLMMMMGVEFDTEVRNYVSDDIYIMMHVCLFVTKNDHFIKRPVCQP